MSTDRRPWYKWFPKDFKSDEKVQCLSPMAELVYRRLLDLMWQSNECRLPNNPSKLKRAVAYDLLDVCFDDVWAELQTDGFELFKITDDGAWIYSKRLMAQKDVCEKRKEAGKLGGSSKRKAKPKQKPSKNKAKTTDTDTDIKEIKKEKSPKFFQSDFDHFWSLYPHKKSKGQAETTWKKLLKSRVLPMNGNDRPDLRFLEDVLQQQQDERRRKREAGEFCPEWKNPSTWLNARAWEDETDGGGKFEVVMTT